MIKWCDCLYFDSDIGKNIKKIQRQLEKGKLKKSVYCISFAQNPQNLFDILNVNELLFSYYKRKEIKIIGLASSKAAAKELMVKIIEEMYQATESFQLEDYFTFSNKR